MKEAQQKRLEELKLQSDSHARAELERKMALRYRRVKFFGKTQLTASNIQLPQNSHRVLQSKWHASTKDFDNDFSVVLSCA